MTGNYGYTPAPSYHQERLRDAADGYIYDVIANGVRNMPGYRAAGPRCGSLGDSILHSGLAAQPERDRSGRPAECAGPHRAKEVQLI